MFSDKKWVYIVDDDGSVRHSLEFLMSTYGFAVKTFPCAEDFFSAVPNNAPGCLILDINLPGLNGWEVQQQLVKAGCQRPVIFITGGKYGDFKEKALKEGAVGFLQKPFNNQELLDLVDQAFGTGMTVWG